MKEPRLAIFLPSLAGGGAERMMVNLASGMRDQGVRVDLVLADATGPYRHLVPEGVPVVDLGAPRVLAALPGLTGYLRRRRPGVLLAAMDHANLVALWARALARVPTRVFVSVRSTLSQEAQNAKTRRGRWMPVLTRAFYPRASAVIAVSQGVADDLRTLLRTAGPQVLVLPNPVVTPGLEAQAAATPDHPWLQVTGVPVILAVGRLTPQKDYPTLLRAFATLSQGRDVRLIILGEGPEHTRLEGLAQGLRISERVAFLGFRDNPFAYMRRASLLALSSAWEGLPGVLIQAMACGTPVVSTDCPSGPREILDAGRFGPLVPVGDAQSLAAAMNLTLEAPPAPDLLRSRAADYGLEAVTRRYREVLGLGADQASGCGA